MKTIAVFCVLVATAIAGPVNNFDWKAKVEGRITGGMVATPHQFPYQVGLILRAKTSYGEVSVDWCGGSLISNRVVLTAAHCFLGVFEAGVFLGSQAMLKNNEGRVVQNVTDKDFIIHSEYDPTTLVNDIALIILPEEVILNEYIKTVNLPRSDQVQSTLEGKVAVITGWGSIGDDKDLSWNNLRYVTATPFMCLTGDLSANLLNVRILPDAACEQIYPHDFYRTQICVSGDNHKSACSGDSGGPLVISEADGSNTVVGFVSFGKRTGCELGYPVVFTRVTSYLDWISENAGVVPKLS